MPRPFCKTIRGPGERIRVSLLLAESRYHLVVTFLVSDTYDASTHRSGSVTVKRCSTALGVMCGRVGETEEEEDDEELHGHGEHPSDGTFSWTPSVQTEFREELEKLMILGQLCPNSEGDGR